MSQYLNFVFNFINCILISVLISQSFCEEKSLEIILLNNSSFEIVESIESNSSLLRQNQINSKRNNTFYSQENREYCKLKSGCPIFNGVEQICCRFANNSRPVCVSATYNRKCKGYLGQLCDQNLKDDPCEERLDLYCRFSLKYGKSLCSCEDNYTPNSGTSQCELKPNYDSRAAMQIYKITMIFASCCLALILIIFLVCILRKSYCAPRRQPVPLDNTTIPDIFTLFPHVGNYDGGPLADGTLPPFEKPPTYDETLTLIRNEIGIPPPAYRSGNTPNSSNPSTPEMSSRFLISNPSLMAVNNQREGSSRTSSDTNLSSDESIAGPSGCNNSHGIDNPAFN